MAKSAAGIIAVAKRHLGEEYVLGARAPLGNRGCTGPWDCAEYRMNDAPVPVENALDVIRVTQILMRGPRVKKIQQRLTRLGYAPGRADGLYGPQTAHEVYIGPCPGPDRGTP